jgi:hypothetical protein
MTLYECTLAVIQAAPGRWMTVADIQAAVLSTFGRSISRSTASGAAHIHSCMGALKKGRLPDGRVIYAA